MATADEASSVQTSGQHIGLACPMRVRLRCERFKVFGREMAWCNGEVTVLCADESEPVSHAADVLFSSHAAAAPLIRAMRALGSSSGGLRRLFEATVERREAELSRRGAVVLHAVEFDAMLKARPGW